MWFDQSHEVNSRMGGAFEMLGEVVELCDRTQFISILILFKIPFPQQPLIPFLVYFSP